MLLTSDGDRHLIETPWGTQLDEAAAGFDTHRVATPHPETDLPSGAFNRALRSKAV
jgi:hypothetical protein